LTSGVFPFRLPPTLPPSATYLPTSVGRDLVRTIGLVVPALPHYGCPLPTPTGRLRCHATCHPPFAPHSGWTSPHLPCHRYITRDMPLHTTTCPCLGQEGHGRYFPTTTPSATYTHTLLPSHTHTTLPTPAYYCLPTTHPHYTHTTFLHLPHPSCVGHCGRTVPSPQASPLPPHGAEKRTLPPPATFLGTPSLGPPT